MRVYIFKHSPSRLRIILPFIRFLNFTCILNTRSFLTLALWALAISNIEHFKQFIFRTLFIAVENILCIYVVLTAEAATRGVPLKKGVLRNFTQFTGKHLYQSVASLRPATLLKKRLWHRCFPVNFAKFLRTPFFQNTSGGCFCNRFFWIF